MIEKIFDIEIRLEVSHQTSLRDMIYNYFYEICGTGGVANYSTEDYIEQLLFEYSKLED